MATTDSVKAATVMLSGGPTPSPYQEFAKETILKLKSSNLSEKNELKQLNLQLKTYLDDVKRLEALNLTLIDQVDKAKQAAIPKIMDKSSLDKQLEEVRVQLEDVSNECVKHQVNIEENEILNQNLAGKIKFHQNESELQKQKLTQLQILLDEIRNQRDYIVRSAKLAEDDIKREKDRMEKSESELSSLVRTLKDSRVKNKKLEFEIQSFLDELAFRKAVFAEEINELNKKPHEVLSPIDLTNFYKQELLNAVRQIRDDFHKLNDEQIQEYKSHKERELSVVQRQIEEDRVQADISRSRLNASQDLEVQNSRELKSGIDTNKSELGELSNRNAELIRRLGELEATYQDAREKNADKLERIQAEIELLKQQNNSYATDLDYWDRVTRTKLETEIQTYRSILNYQTRVLDKTNLTFAGSTTTSKTDQSKTNASNTTSSSQVGNKSKSESIDILRQVFDYFDSNKSGSINSSEMDKILGRLNVNLSKETYGELLREFDRDASRDIDFDEFCKIMLPVFTGKFEDEELWYAFKKFDLDNSGHISVGELKYILSKIGQNFTDSQIASMIATVDANNDGKLSFQEFARLMKSPSAK